MPANAYGDRFAFANTPAWHKLGQVFTEKLDLVSATKLAKCDYVCEAVPTWGVVDGQYIEIPDRFAIVRKPNYEDQTYKVLDVVSGRYNVIQNMEFAEWLNPISEIYPVETVGALGDGENFFFTFDAGMTDIGGEEVHQYFLGNDNKTGFKATTFAYTPVRVVCQNTLQTGLSQATIKLHVKHYKGNADKIKEMGKLAEQMKATIDYTNALFGKLAVAKFSATEFAQMIEQIILKPVKEEEKKAEEGEAPINVTDEFFSSFTNRELQKAELVTMFEKYNDENPSIAGTKWSAYNVITEYEDHTLNGRGNSKYVSALWGARAKTKGDTFKYLLNAK